MDNSRVGGKFLSGPSGGFVDFEVPVHRHQQLQLGYSSNPTHHHMHSSMNMATGCDDSCSMGITELKGLDNRSFSLSFGKGKACSIINDGNHSEEDEPSFPEDGNGENLTRVKKGKKGSSWQRMKWTDNIVRLLIQVVACVGDDGIEEGLKRRSGILQKKGKWKTVSKIMITKGCYASPQQCEDKFNDLNKRYKRLNDILGRGTSCRVVENPALMDSMPQLSAKMKDDVKKILSSKHLFYKEMCAYHNGQRIPNCTDFDLQVHSLPTAQCSKENNASEAEEVEESDDSDDDDSDSEGDNHGDQNVDMAGEYNERKDAHQLDGFQAEVAELFQDSTKSNWEKKEWIKKWMIEVQDQRVGIQFEAFELEKRRFKWLRFCSEKDRELEMSRLENERLILENERMMLQLRHKDLEMDAENPGASFNLTPVGINRPQGKDQIDFCRHE